MELAYEKNTNLAFNTVVLKECGKKYSNIARELRTMSKNLDKCISELEQDGWTTPAGTAFHEMTKTNWSENIEKYAALLDTLNNILLQAADSYEDLVEDYVRSTKVMYDGHGGEGRRR